MRDIKEIRAAAKDLDLGRKIDKYMEQWKSDPSIRQESESLAIQINKELESGETKLEGHHSQQDVKVNLSELIKELITNNGEND